MSAALAAFVITTMTAAPSSAQDIDPPTDVADVEQIGDSTLRSLADEPSSAPPGTAVAAEVYGSDLDATTAAILEVGGRLHARVDGWFVEASIPVDRLNELANHPAVTRLAGVTWTSNSSPSAKQLQANAPLADAIESTLGIDQWHQFGHRGAGQRIGILDIFGSAELTDAVANGRLPIPAGTFCRRGGQPCQIATGGAGPHGVGVAEIAHTTAPDAEIWLATVSTTGDLSAAVDWFIANGITVINRSELSEFDGPGDGTGPLNSIIDRAVAAGIVWVSAGGNAGGDFARDGQNWVGDFNDPDGNGIHNWADGSERMEFVCGFLLGMRWDDWDPRSVATDYDLWIYDSFSDRTPERTANDVQSHPEHPPLERIETNCSSPTDRDYLSIHLFDDVDPDGTDQIQILGNLTPMTEWTNYASATFPGADSANPGAVTVNSLIRPSSQAIAGYSSQGPTFDGRAGIDLAAASCLPAFEFAGCFAGTSSSAPLFSGFVAVMRGAGLVQQPEDIDALLPSLTVDRGAAGIDPLYGHGAFVVPSPDALNVVSDVPLCLGLPATIIGTNGRDVLRGTEGADVIFAGGGADTIVGLGGDDVICGGAGNDTIKGGDGDDRLLGGGGRDIVEGQAGQDTLNGGGGNDRLHGGSGNDQIKGRDGKDRLQGGLGDDTLFGGSGRDRITGGSGADAITGGGGIDRCPSPGDVLASCEET